MLWEADATMKRAMKEIYWGGRGSGGKTHERQRGEKEGGEGAARGGRWGMTAKRYRVSLGGGDENVPQLDGGDGCPTL